MKVFALIALIGFAQSVRFISGYDDIATSDFDTSGVNLKAMMQIKGVPESELQPHRAWSKPWPQGIDDGTEDPSVLHLTAEQKAALAKAGIPQFALVPHANTDKAVWPQSGIDDGTDDDSVTDDIVIKHASLETVQGTTPPAGAAGDAKKPFPSGKEGEGKPADAAAAAPASA